MPERRKMNKLTFGRQKFNGADILSREAEFVHRVDVARKIGVSQPAVQKAIKILEANEYVEFDVYIDVHDQGRFTLDAVLRRLYAFYSSPESCLSRSATASASIILSMSPIMNSERL